MSRIYDDSCIHVPHNAWGYDSFYANDIEYRMIVGHPKYYISSQGDVLSFANPLNPRILKTWENKHGHKIVCMDGDKYLVHRLVAETFIPNPEGYPIVRHLDDDPNDNSIRNLAWGTSKDNREDSIRNGNDYRKGVYCFELDKLYRSCADAARDLGVSKSAITQCCQGLTGYANRYHLCYEDEIEEKRNDSNWFRERNKFKPVIAYKDEGEELYFDSRKAAAEYLGIPDCGISSVISGRINSTHGWKFREG